MPALPPHLVQELNVNGRIRCGIIQPILHHFKVSAPVHILKRYKRNRLDTYLTYPHMSFYDGLSFKMHAQKSNIKGSCLPSALLYLLEYFQ